MPETYLKNNTIFFLDVDTIFANPYQPRQEFDENALQDLADSLRQYGILQPITVTEAGQMDDGRNKYELIAGERRTRAARIAGLKQIPAVVRVGDDDTSRFELAIIENLQREDLNPIERAKAFLRLIEEFNLSHAQIGKKMGKSREFVSNSIRLLSLPSEIKNALATRSISEGHTRPLMMLIDRPDEQMTLFKEIVYKKMSVRESEKIARRIAHEKIRKLKLKTNPKVASLEKTFSEKLGTRVLIEEGEVGGKIVIDYFSVEDLEDLLEVFKKSSSSGDNPHALLDKFARKHGSLVEPPTAPMPPASAIPQVADDEDFDSVIDDVELDIVSDPQQNIPQEYYAIFKIANETPSAIPFIDFSQDKKTSSPVSDFTI